MSKKNLNELLNLKNINILDLTTDKHKISIQVIYWYFYIYNWYCKDKVVDFKEYTLLINYSEDIRIDNIPWELITKYKSLLEPIAFTILNKRSKCLKIYKEKSVDYSIYAIHIKSNNIYYVIFRFPRDKECIVIDIDTLDIYHFDTMEECINYVDLKCNKDFEYTLLRVIYRPYVNPDSFL
jgi:hypothetical protein